MRPKIADKLDLKSQRNRGSASLNPFDRQIKQNKEIILGKQPRALSRTVDRRHHVMRRQLQLLGRTNVLRDRRFGERCSKLSRDEKVTQRFILQRSNKYSATAHCLPPAYDVSDRITLKQADESVRADDEEDLNGCLDAEFVDHLHFGGPGLDHHEEDSLPKSRRAVLDEVIARSKTSKFEKQAQREKLLDLTEHLDEKWKTLASDKSFFGTKAPRLTEKETRDDTDGYDALVRELHFDSKAKPADRLRSAEEMATAEKERLEHLEAERLHRMQRGSKINQTPQDFPCFGQDVNRMGHNKSLSTKSDEVEQPSRLPVSKHSPCSGTLPVDLPYVIAMPDSFRELCRLLGSHSALNHGILLDRLIKCSHPSLREGNKRRLTKLFSMLLQYVDRISSTLEKDDLQRTLDQLTTIVYGLCQLLDSRQVVKICLAFLQRYNRLVSSKIPSFGVLSFLRLMSVLVSSSEFSHAVITPCLTFGTSILSRLQTKISSNERCVGAGLLLSTILVEFVAISNRYVPEIAGFLLQVLSLAEVGNTKEEASTSRSVIPFDSGMTPPAFNCNRSVEPLSIKEVFTLTSELSTETYKLSCLNAALIIIRKLVELWHGQLAAMFVFQRMCDCIEKLPCQLYPDGLQDSVRSTSALLKKRVSPLRLPSTLSATRNAAAETASEFVFLEPRIDRNFKPERRGRAKTRNAEHQKLLHVYKKEFRGTLRELRRDREFLTREQLAKQQKQDSERSRKTQKLMASLMGQESDYKKQKRLKKKAD